jgi:hypothetical protein
MSVTAPEFTAKVLSTSTSYGAYDSIRHQYEVQVKMNKNAIGIYTGENDFEDAFDWAVREIDWVGNGDKAGTRESVDIGHDHAYDIAAAITNAAGGVS